MVHHLHCGSSPRVRGTVYKFINPQYVERFIPARAGNGVEVAHDIDW